MSTGAGSGIATRRVLLLGAGDRASRLETTLEADGVEVVAVPTPPVALSTLDAIDVDCLVVDEGSVGRPTDFFGAAQRTGHQLPGVYVGDEARRLPASVEQAPANVSAAASMVRQKLLASAAADAEPAVTDDPLSAYGSTVAHELRNHLGAAGMAVESMDGPTKEQATTALERLRDLATEAEAVATGAVSDVEVLELDEVVAAAADRVRVESFDVEPACEGTVEANRALLTLMFENLFRNAVEHGSTSARSGADDEAENGAPGTTVRCLDTEVGFAVVDDGPGFETDRPFEWGYTTGSGQGTGLAVVRRIAQAHGWHVSASNDDGARIDVVLE